jgi:GNAT superfamily N-acetyltransferase
MNQRGWDHLGRPEIRAVSPSQVQEFRYEVLQPKVKTHSIYELDDAPGTLHIGAFVGGGLAAVATVCPQPMPNSSETGEWRLRGMATWDTYRGIGLGKRLAQACLDYALSERGSLVWCSARLSAAGFYRSLGFEEVGGKPFSLLEYSREPYILMRFIFPR